MSSEKFQGIQSVCYITAERWDLRSQVEQKKKSTAGFQWRRAMVDKSQQIHNKVSDTCNTFDG